MAVGIRQTLIPVETRNVEIPNHNNPKVFGIQPILIIIIIIQLLLNFNTCVSITGSVSTALMVAFKVLPGLLPPSFDDKGKGQDLSLYI
jgi:hypothetical protein